MNTIQKIKGTFKIIVRSAAVVAAALFIGTVQGQNLPGYPGGGSFGGFSTFSNTYSYLDYTGTNTVYVTNNAVGFTNDIMSSATAITTPNLFSVWYAGTNAGTGNAGVTNAAFVGGTNSGVIPNFPGRFIAIQAGGTLLSNNIVFVNGTVITNTLVFARSTGYSPLATGFETTPGLILRFVDTIAAGQGASFNDYTNIEVDACGSLQLISWQLQAATNGVYSLTNPFVRWRSTGANQ